ncbi:short chain dehydrogenase [Serratia rubidaea]|uniref:Short chain dehydrogenase n=1 Tax=Serratia rubidaea TaxID=61652 RepID=A0A4U9HMY2_SERRU|nr:short chain dehydrogenase [Serratia rubidaea]
MRFSGKNIVITGGTSGMGLAGALRVVAEGGRVALTGLNPARLAAAAEQLPADSLVLSNDAASEADIEALGAALASWGVLTGFGSTPAMRRWERWSRWMPQRLTR